MDEKINTVTGNWEKKSKSDIIMFVSQTAARFTGLKESPKKFANTTPGHD